MKRVAIVGAGVSGLASAQLLKDRYEVKVFEQESRPGGLIRCERVNGSLFHLCGGHVFNTKNREVNDWFWSHFDKERDFIKADRHSAVCLEGERFVDYPIENHLYQLEPSLHRKCLEDVRQMLERTPVEPHNFDEFLRLRFGPTLYSLYFKPYNEKVWRRDLTSVPLAWLAGKLPMPTPKEILAANERQIEEKEFVHSTFYYEKQGGSQFIADTLAKGIDVACDSEVERIEVGGAGIVLNCQNRVQEKFDKLVFCGNLKDLPNLLSGVELGGYEQEIEKLEYHGTTAVFCETDAIPYSWFYQPSPRHQSHRFICTGNFSPTNNAPGKMTCTVEFTDEVNEDEIKVQLGLMPFRPRYLTHHYSKYSYPIQHNHTREFVKELKAKLMTHQIALVGRFAEWEYYNMDTAISSAMVRLAGF